MQRPRLGLRELRLVATLMGLAACSGLTETGTEVEFCDDGPLGGGMVRSLEIASDTLTITYGYGGGCEHHYLRLCAPKDGPVWLEEDPVATKLVLYHDNNHDNCEADITDILEFDLLPLRSRYEDAYPEGTMFEIRIAGASVLYPLDEG